MAPRRIGSARSKPKKAHMACKAVRAITRGQKTCSPAQAALAAGVAVSTVWLWLNGSKLASRSVGGRRLINVASLYDLIGVAAADGDQGED